MTNYVKKNDEVMSARRNIDQHESVDEELLLIGPTERRKILECINRLALTLHLCKQQAKAIRKVCDSAHSYQRLPLMFTISSIKHEYNLLKNDIDKTLTLLSEFNTHYPHLIINVSLMERLRLASISCNHTIQRTERKNERALSRASYQCDRDINKITNGLLIFFKHITPPLPNFGTTTLNEADYPYNKTSVRL